MPIIPTRIESSIDTSLEVLGILDQGFDEVAEVIGRLRLDLDTRVFAIGQIDRPVDVSVAVSAVLAGVHDARVEVVVPVLIRGDFFAEVDHRVAVLHSTRLIVESVLEIRGNTVQRIAVPLNRNLTSHQRIFIVLLRESHEIQTQGVETPSAEV